MWRFSLSRVSPSPSTSRPRCGGPLCLVSLPLPLHPGQDVEVLSVSCLSLSIQAKMWRFSLSRVSPSPSTSRPRCGGPLCLVSLPLHPGQDVEVLSVSCLSLYIQAKMWRSSLSRVSLPLPLPLSAFIQAKMWRFSLSRVSPSPSTSRPRCGGPLCLVSLPLPLHPGQDVEVLSVSCLSLSLYIQAKMWRSSLSRVSPSPSTSRPRCGGPLCLVSLPLHPGQDVEVLSVSCFSLSLYIQAKMWRFSLSRVSPSPSTSRPRCGGPLCLVSLPLRGSCRSCFCAAFYLFLLKTVKCLNTESDYVAVLLPTHVRVREAHKQE
ncbi:uncharacterized protein LOC127915926 isoform X7 [Oncorhynchus keta]|uniref:uncharacterized protein LOC127915926 isoform X7 n=1 Tax=Oncorhynchus keta TaxID=8018 RepID=UPI00227A8256|nr:uncharacterized protein LOC127915926 isoform X7 [Oncorhynchus keta]